MTAFNPDLAARIAATGIPLSAGHASQAAVEPPTCARCGQPVVRFADDVNGDGLMHAHGNDDASDNPATWAGHAAVIEGAGR